MSTVNKPLKYLFRATYRDGSEFIQPPHDTSQFKAVCNGCQEHILNIDGVCTSCGSDDLHFKSAFADVDMDRVRLFELVGDGITVGVDLDTGLFRVNGFEVQMHPMNHIFTSPLKLIFYRIVERVQIVNVAIQSDLSGVVSPGGEDASVKKYFIGWESGGLKREMGVE